MKSEEVNDIKKRLTPFFQENKAVRRVILFGSYARGSQSRKSDLDIAIIMETDKRFFDRYEEFETISDRLDARHVDLLIYTPEEFAAIAHRPFIRRLNREGKIIYEH